MTAIVVDDDEHLLEALRFSLELDGLRVIAHRSADTVLPGSLPTANACLVLDYRLPTANGLDLLGRLKAEGIDLPAILVTSHASGEVRARARDLGATLIEKPLLGDTLVTAIRAALDQRSVDPGQ
ncbi:MAG: response regulator [Caulobacter sp.]|nr:response regulator [Caulobacter sp.]